MAIVRTTVQEAIRILNAGTAIYDGGDLEIHPGSLPADGDTLVAASGALVIFTLPTPCFASAIDGTDKAIATANTIADALGVAAGNAGFGLFRDALGNQFRIADVTLLAGNGFVKLNDLAISIGQSVAVTLMTLEYSQNG